MRIYRPVGKTRTVRTRGGTQHPRTIIQRSSTFVGRVELQGTATGALRITPTDYSHEIYHTAHTTQAAPPETPTSTALPDSASEWVERNIGKVQKKAGKWIAVNRKGILASAASLDGVYQKARMQGVYDPLVFKVPKPTSLRKVVSSRIR